MFLDFYSNFYLIFKEKNQLMWTDGRKGHLLRLKINVLQVRLEVCYTDGRYFYPLKKHFK